MISKPCSSCQKQKSIVQIACGHELCESCLKQLNQKKNQLICPICSQMLARLGTKPEISQSYLEKYNKMKMTKRENEFQINCPNELCRFLLMIENPSRLFKCPKCQTNICGNTFHDESEGLFILKKQDGQNSQEKTLQQQHQIKNINNNRQREWCDNYNQQQQQQLGNNSQENIMQQFENKIKNSQSTKAGNDVLNMVKEEKQQEIQSQKTQHAKKYGTVDQLTLSEQMQLYKSEISQQVSGRLKLEEIQEEETNRKNTSSCMQSEIIDKCPECGYYLIMFPSDARINLCQICLIIYCRECKQKLDEQIKKKHLEKCYQQQNN